MISSLARSAIAVGILSFSALGTPALAHTRPHTMLVSYAGVATAVPRNNSPQLTVRVNGTSVSATVDGRTRVQSTIFGSTNDLVVGAIVDLQSVKGTTVEAIRILPRLPRAQHVPRMEDYGADDDWAYAMHDAARITRVPQRHVRHSGPLLPRLPRDADGIIQSFNSSTNALTVLMRGGKSAMYTVANDVKVTKLVNDSASDLRIGQTLQVTVNKLTNDAVVVTINNS